MRIVAFLAASVTAAVCLGVDIVVPTLPNVFQEKPYLQLGNAPQPDAADRLNLLWHTSDHDADWSVRYRLKRPGAAWRTAGKPAMQRIVVRTIEPHRVYRTELNGLAPGAEFEYEVQRAGTVVFSSTGKARPTARQPYRLVIFGDCAAGTMEQRAIAYQTYKQKPDMVFIPGDIVYSRGRISEYRAKFFPVYNAEQADPSVGAPLLRSTLFIAAPGNHDILNPDLTRDPDALAYFYYWSQPLNGPANPAGSPNSPFLKGEQPDKDAFFQAAGQTFPRMANYSFNYGNAHWTVLDANPYVDWTSPVLREWLRSDLQSAQSATWRFVAFHHPGFNSSRAHFDEQQMRVIADVFEEGKVDVVFSGHVHNYQRSYPLRFKTKPQADGRTRGPKGQVDGTWTLDKSFDGVKKTRLNGVLYIVTGAGGAKLYNPEQEPKPDSWQEFTAKFISTHNSLTTLDVKDKRLTFLQLAADGHELDRFTVTK